LLVSIGEAKFFFRDHAGYPHKNINILSAICVLYVMRKIERTGDQAQRQQAQINLAVINNRKLFSDGATYFAR
jgi:hypothetical protein